MQILDDIANIFEGKNVWIHLVTAFIVWLYPSLELLFLLYGLTTLDWLLDVRQFFKSNSPKIDLWAKITKPCIEKLLYYTAFAMAVFATQQHLFKDSLPVYVVMMSIPVSAELLSIATTVEQNTGIKVVTKIQEIFSGFFGSKIKEDEDK